METKSKSLEPKTVELVIKTFGRNSDSRAILSNMENSKFVEYPETAKRFVTVLCQSYSDIKSVAIDMSERVTYAETFDGHKHMTEKDLNTFIDLIERKDVITVFEKFKVVGGLECMSTCISFAALKVAQSNSKKSKDSFDNFIGVTDSEIALSTIKTFTGTNASGSVNSLISDALETGDIHVVDWMCRFVNGLRDFPNVLNYLNETTIESDNFILDLQKDLKRKSMLRA